MTAKLGNIPTGKQRGRLIVGVVGAVLSLGYLGVARELSWGTMAQPGAAAFPMVLGIGLLGTSLLTIWESRTRIDSGESAGFPRGRELKRIVGLMIAFAAYLAVMPVLGQLIASTAFALAVLRLLSSLSWPRCVAYAVLLASATYFLFVVVLGVLMPTGPLGF